MVDLLFLRETPYWSCKTLGYTLHGMLTGEVRLWPRRHGLRVAPLPSIHLICNWSTLTCPYTMWHTTRHCRNVTNQTETPMCQNLGGRYTCKNTDITGRTDTTRMSPKFDEGKEAPMGTNKRGHVLIMNFHQVGEQRISSHSPDRSHTHIMGQEKDTPLSLLYKGRADKVSLCVEDFIQL